MQTVCIETIDRNIIILYLQRENNKRLSYKHILLY